MLFRCYFYTNRVMNMYCVSILHIDELGDIPFHIAWMRVLYVVLVYHAYVIILDSRSFLFPRWYSPVVIYTMGIPPAPPQGRISNLKSTLTFFILSQFKVQWLNYKIHQYYDAVGNNRHSSTKNLYYTERKKNIEQQTTQVYLHCVLLYY